MKRAVILAVTVLAILSSAPLYAGVLNPGASLDRPGEGLLSPYYTAGLPSYFIPANQVGTLSSPLVGGQTGTVTTTVYQNPADSNHLGFNYVIVNTSTAELIRATFAAAPWVGVTILDTGADGTGTSTAGTGLPPLWTDGDPIYIGRDATSYPFFVFRSDQHGTSLVSPTGGTSADIWLSTDATRFSSSNGSVLDGGQSATYGIYAPVPEPATLALIGLGGIGLLARRFRKKTQS